MAFSSIIAAQAAMPRKVRKCIRAKPHIRLHSYNTLIAKMLMRCVGR